MGAKQAPWVWLMPAVLMDMMSPFWPCLWPRPLARVSQAWSASTTMLPRAALPTASPTPVIGQLPAR